MANDTLKNKAIRGINWSILEQIIVYIIFFIVTVILSRILSPAEFGSIAMITVFTGFANFFSNLGFPSALIQRKEITEKHLSTVFWINLLIGFLIWIVFLSTAHIISSFYNQPALIPLIYFLSTVYVIESFNMVQTAILTREMKFKVLSLRKIFANLLAGIVAIILALSGFKEWSLAWRVILTSLLTTLFIWLYSKWRPQLIFAVSAFKDLANYSFNLFGVNLMTYIIRNADNLLIGKIMGNINLGLYNRAYSLMLLPVKNIGTVIGQVMFPTLSQMQDEPIKFKNVYLNSVASISFITAPLMIFISILAEPFILAIYGNKWTATIPLLQVLALVGYLHSIIFTIGWIYQANGKTALQFKITLVANSILLCALIYAIFTKVLLNVVYTYGIVYAILFYPQTKIAIKLIDISFYEFVKRIIPGIILSSLVGILIFAISRSSLYDINSIFHLIIIIIFALSIYIGINQLFKIKSYNYIKNLIRELANR